MHWYALDVLLGPLVLVPEKRGLQTCESRTSWIRIPDFDSFEPSSPGLAPIHLERFSFVTWLQVVKLTMAKKWLDLHHIGGSRIDANHSCSTVYSDSDSVIYWHSVYCSFKFS